MSIVIKKNGKIDTRVVDYEKLAVELSLKVAKLKSEEERLQKETRFLGSFKAQLQKKIADEEDKELRRKDGKFQEYGKLLQNIEAVNEKIGSFFPGR